jgi:hypothetical protein
MPHTPEPWTIRYDFNVFGYKDRLVANCGGRTSSAEVDGGHNENIANARLIAAAPRMLKALREADILLTYFMSFARDAAVKPIRNFTEWDYTRIEKGIQACHSAIKDASEAE